LLVVVTLVFVLVFTLILATTSLIAVNRGRLLASAIADRSADSTSDCATQNRAALPADRVTYTGAYAAADCAAQNSTILIGISTGRQQQQRTYHNNFLHFSLL
jgi:hypothetical protein